MSDYVEQPAQNIPRPESSVVPAAPDVAQPVSDEPQGNPAPQELVEECKWPAEVERAIVYLKDWARREVSLSHSGLSAEDRADVNP